MAGCACVYAAAITADGEATAVGLGVGCEGERDGVIGPTTAATGSFAIGDAGILSGRAVVQLTTDKVIRARVLSIATDHTPTLRIAISIFIAGGPILEDIIARMAKPCTCGTGAALQFERSAIDLKPCEIDVTISVCIAEIGRGAEICALAAVLLLVFGLVERKKL